MRLAYIIRLGFPEILINVTFCAPVLFFTSMQKEHFFLNILPPLSIVSYIEVINIFLDYNLELSEV